MGSPPRPSPTASVRNRVEGEIASLEDAEEVQQAETVDRPPDEDKDIPRSKVYTPLALPVLTILAPASILGVLARLGLQALATFDGRSVFPLLYVQALGCFIMGIGVRLKEPLGNYYGPFYTALATGFCGSLTTFSGWQLDIFSTWTDAGGYHRSGLYSAFDGIGVAAITLSLSLGSLAFGHSVADVMLPYVKFPAFPPRWQRYTITLVSTLVYGSTIITYFLLSPRFRHEATAALIFSYPGTLTRYLLSVLLNERFKALPAGTFTANVLGTGLLGACHVLQSVQPPVSPSSCAILQGIMDGYCGCLTTVSTFAAEISDLGQWRATRYAFLSLAVGQLILVVVVGTPIWTNAVVSRATCTFV